MNLYDTKSIWYHTTEMLHTIFSPYSGFAQLFD